ncbi:hypothetical protein AVEN_106700-1 [Araneus ventricosus]|uniref:Uncharacterized protein n=1 Tax=Araneus ventricosus TaxID=182803 RepID=A0A4Y2F304_ARAVE|nr:hypothetical protein AVEN_106700-1 [Araneus ventricosus]
MRLSLAGNSIPQRDVTLARHVIRCRSSLGDSRSPHDAMRQLGTTLAAVIRCRNSLGDSLFTTYSSMPQLRDVTLARRDSMRNSLGVSSPPDSMPQLGM